MADPKIDLVVFEQLFSFTRCERNWSSLLDFTPPASWGKYTQTPALVGTILISNNCHKVRPTVPAGIQYWRQYIIQINSYERLWQRDLPRFVLPGERMFCAESDFAVIYESGVFCVISCRTASVLWRGFVTNIYRNGVELPKPRERLLDAHSQWINGVPLFEIGGASLTFYIDIQARNKSVLRFCRGRTLPPRLVSECWKFCWSGFLYRIYS